MRSTPLSRLSCLTSAKATSLRGGCELLHLLKRHCTTAAGLSGPPTWSQHKQQDAGSVRGKSGLLCLQGLGKTVSTTALIVTNQRHSNIEGLLSRMAPKGPSSSAQHGGQADGSAADVLAGGANAGAGLLTSTEQVRCSQSVHL